MSLQRKQVKSSAMRLPCVVLLLLRIGGVSGVPYLLLSNKAPKCVSVEAPSQTTLYIDYHAPDLVSVDDATSSGDTPEDGTSKTGLDARYDERFKQRMETLKRANLKDIHISVTPRDAMGGVVINRRPKTEPNDEDDHELPQKIRQPVEAERGQIAYYTANMNGGTVEICVQSYTATVEMPSRVSLNIHGLDDHKGVEQELAEERRTLTKEQVEAENKLVKEETSRITSELMRMHRRAKSIGGDARYAKDREEAFHNLSVSLNKAVARWPVFRMLVVLVGGYFQVSHVVRFMKSRHIY